MQYGKPSALPLDEWHEDMGPMLWWQFPITEPPYCGTPHDSDWPGYHTHFTPFQVPDTVGTSRWSEAEEREAHEAMQDIALARLP